MSLRSSRSKLQHLDTLRAIDDTLEEIRAKQDFLSRTEDLLEANPMLGTRGVRLAMLLPEITRMQTRALFQAATRCMHEGVDVRVEGHDPARLTPERVRHPAGHSWRRRRPP